MMLADSIAIVFFVVLGIFYIFYFLMANPLTQNNNRAHVYGFLNDDIYVITEPQRLS
jgi:preprotein translocase subunit YajC